MGTRGAIARKTKTGFKGVYHHWDSYPSGLGEMLWKCYHKWFNRDINKMLKFLIDGHPGGWSTINEFAETGKLARRTGINPKGAYPRKEAWIVNEQNASGSGIEYVYVFENNKMHILSSYTARYGKMIGAFGTGDPKATWKVCETINLNGKEPNWNKLDEKCSY